MVVVGATVDEDVVEVKQVGRSPVQPPNSSHVRNTERGEVMHMMRQTSWKTDCWLQLVEYCIISSSGTGGSHAIRAQEGCGPLHPSLSHSHTAASPVNPASHSSTHESLMKPVEQATLRPIALGALALKHEGAGTIRNRRMRKD
jgi:hypothetical protein